jgi:hypothetical protein
MCSRDGRYLLRRTAVSLGRSTDSKGDVDVDLAKERPACKVSRLQAQLTLGRDGVWVLQNVGRRSLSVNGAPVGRVEVDWAARIGVRARTFTHLCEQVLETSVRSVNCLLWRC